MTLHLHIDHLVVEGLGFDAQGLATLDEAFRTELARLVADRGLGLSANITASSLSLPTLKFAAVEANGPPLGARIAGALHAGLSGIPGHPGRSSEAAATTAAGAPHVTTRS